MNPTKIRTGNQNKLIILRGYPGSGKTTVGKALENKGVGVFIDHNAILTFVANIAGNDTGIYNEIAQLEKAICKKLLKEGSTVIVARGFSELQSIKEYESIAQENNIPWYIFRLNVPTETLAKRVQSPERKQDFNPTITTQSLNNWIIQNPLQTHVAEHVIDNTNNINTTLRKIFDISNNC